MDLTVKCIYFPLCLTKNKLLDVTLQNYRVWMKRVKIITYAPLKRKAIFFHIAPFKWLPVWVRVEPDDPGSGKQQLKDASAFPAHFLYVWFLLEGDRQEVRPFLPLRYNLLSVPSASRGLSILFTRNNKQHQQGPLKVYAAFFWVKDSNIIRSSGEQTEPSQIQLPIPQKDEIKPHLNGCKSGEKGGRRGKSGRMRWQLPLNGILSHSGWTKTRKSTFILSCSLTLQIIPFLIWNYFLHLSFPD